MDKKLRQVTDNIHGTIFLSRLESVLISTPYFYRLHDIYQSSTVYMTFPANRTKRYEHSLGTMELASSMLFSAVSNADANTRKQLFKDLKSYFKEIFELAILECETQTAPYFTSNQELINDLFEKECGDNDDEVIEKIISTHIKKAIIDDCFMDSALDQFQYYPMNIDEKSDFSDVQNVFLYRCLLQAVRIVALFHDVGHPPYSHIIEDALNEIYEECTKDENKDKWIKEKMSMFMKCMECYKSKNAKKAYSCRTLYSNTSLMDAHLHERVGLSFLQSSIDEEISKIILNILESSQTQSHKIAHILYYIMVVELAVAILTEKDIFFKSFHKIVDGIIDSDRLDYIMRDSLNSGVDWGKIPYKRLINSTKLMCIENVEKNSDEDKKMYAIAYPQKVTDDIEDLLLVRYKIFARINFHHRCMKTAATLKSAIKELSIDYLKSEDNKCINADICKLWTSLSKRAGDKKLRVILWNDSWLISVLHTALLNLNQKTTQSKVLLKENLEEILLNKKRYYSLFKRGIDSRKFIEKIFMYADITKEKLESLKNKELDKYHRNLEKEIGQSDILENPKADALDSLQRIDILEQMFDTGNLELFSSSIPLLDKSLDETMTEVLEDLVKRKILTDYKIIENLGRSKTGLPRHQDLLDEIYLYKGNECFAYNEKDILKQQIDAIEQNIPWLYLYYVPGKNSDEKLSDTICNEMAQKIGYGLKERYKELFESTQKNE